MSQIMPDSKINRHIRVFISSTFKDMMNERNHLVKFVFPRLRKLCEERQVVWGEVDLRWGVTDEQAADGKVLPICLEEIKQCRPYFIGILGERYGWIPAEIPEHVIEREPWLKEHIHDKKSVTELEILHGVLNNPKMADHAFFYFRDPNYVKTVPDDKRSDFVEEVTDEEIKAYGQEEAERRAAERRVKLFDLKTEIMGSDFPSKGFSKPEELGKQVLEDLTEVIN